MKKIILYIAVLFISGPILSQSLSNYNEQVLINVDRTIYIVGENINFSATLLSNQNNLSEILYVELITSNGKQIYGGKYQIIDSKCFGNIPISDNIVSGNYYVRAYTKFMRNYGPVAYDYQLIKIINPLKKEILNINRVKDSVNFDFLSCNLKQDYFNIDIIKYKFSRREDVKIKVHSNKNDSLINTIIAVIPDKTENLNYILPLQSTSRDEKLGTEIYDQYFYMPETRGITLTGSLINTKGNKPLAGKKINLSIIGSNKNSFYSIFTKENGYFYFALPSERGRKDIFLSPENIKNTNTKILVDNDFCFEPIILPNPEFLLNKQELKAAYNLAINKKVHLEFNHDTVIDNYEASKNYNESLPFYGKPTSILYIDEYIDLPTLEDYFTEIPFLVKIKKLKDKKQFKVLGTHPDLNIYDPLIMVDLVSVNNIDRILDITPKKIQRIEVVNSPYIKGDITYGGIINIISVKNDLAGIKLSESGMFLNYLFFSDIHLTKRNNISRVPENLPDPRNILYWSPQTEFNSEGFTEFNIKTADTISKYKIVVIGIKRNGQRVYNFLNFEVI